MKKTAILIVLYDKEICDSTTVESLTKLELKGTRLIIHNNGPYEINLTKEQSHIFKKKGVDDVILVNSIENKPLSIIYNDFINANLDCEIFSIFDDDSEISMNYISILKNDSFEIELPKILSRVDSKVYYPTVDRNVFSEDGNIITGDIFSIGSGLTITRTVIDKFNKHKIKLFDEHYALYGVDFSFFRRLKILQKKGEAFRVSSNFTLLHSLSKAEVIQSEFRHNERLIDFSLTVRHYPTVHLYLSFIKRMTLDFVKLNVKDASLVLSTYFNGSHPRCRK